MLRLISFIVCQLVLVSAVAQNLSVKSLELDVRDLTASHQQVADLNGVPCALLKVQMLDRMAKAEGNIIRRVDNGTETWLYLTEGTKMVKIIGEKHKPLMVNISDWFPKGVERKLTYILELDSDLPPELLLGAPKKETQPVAMSGSAEPLLPAWWNTAMESDLYVGIAPPTLDGKRAKTMALSNAIGMYANASRQPASFTGRYNNQSGESESESIQMESNLRLTMDVEVLQEYYNHRGEYFVLCRIRDSKKEDASVAMIEWLTTFETIRGSGNGMMDVNMAMKLMLDGSELQGGAAYSVDGGMNSITCNGIGFTLPSDFEYSAGNEKPETGLFVTVANSLGAAQTRLLYALPFVPDSLRVMNIEMRQGENVSVESACMGYSAMLPHRLVMKDITPDGLAFSFPMNPAGLTRVDLTESMRKAWDNARKKEDKALLKEGYGFSPVFWQYEPLSGHERSEGCSVYYRTHAMGAMCMIAALSEALNFPSGLSEKALKILNERHSSSVGLNIGLDNIIWGLDDSYALRMVDFDKIGAHCVSIITGNL